MSTFLATKCELEINPMMPYWTQLLSASYCILDTLKLNSYFYQLWSAFLVSSDFILISPGGLRKYLGKLISCLKIPGITFYQLGDAYLIVAGCPVKTNSHALKICDMAFDMVPKMAFTFYCLFITLFLIWAFASF